MSAPRSRLLASVVAMGCFAAALGAYVYGSVLAGSVLLVCSIWGFLVLSPSDY